MVASNDNLEVAAMGFSEWMTNRDELLCECDNGLLKKKTQ